MRLSQTSDTLWGGSWGNKHPNFPLFSLVSPLGSPLAKPIGSQRASSHVVVGHTNQPPGMEGKEGKGEEWIWRAKER